MRKTRTHSKCEVCVSNGDSRVNGIMACSACRCFFKNHSKKTFQCEFESKCEITAAKRNCHACRLKKCIDLGMEPPSPVIKKKTAEVIDLTDDSKLQMTTYVKLERINVASYQPVKAEKPQAIVIEDSDLMELTTEETESEPRKLRTNRAVNYFRIQNPVIPRARKSDRSKPASRPLKRLAPSNKIETVNKDVNEVNEDTQLRGRSVQKAMKRRVSREKRIEIGTSTLGVSETATRKSISVGTQSVINNIISNALGDDRTYLSIDPRQAQSIKMALQLFNNFCSTLFT